MCVFMQRIPNHGDRTMVKRMNLQPADAEELGDSVSAVRERSPEELVGRLVTSERNRIGPGGRGLDRSDTLLPGDDGTTQAAE